MMDEIRLLIVDDEPAWYGSIVAEIDRLADVALERRSTLADGLRTYERGGFDLVLLDLGLPDVILPGPGRELATAWRLWRQANRVGNLWVCTGLSLEHTDLGQIRDAGDRVLFKRQIDRAESRQLASDIVAECHRRAPGEPVHYDSGPIAPAVEDSGQFSTGERRALTTTLTDLRELIRQMESAHA